VTLLIIGLYLAMVLAIGGLSHRLLAATGEDYFLATRTIGPFLLLMSLFGTHMTAFSLLGAAGEAYRRGIGVFAMMASSSAFVVPIVFWAVGVRLWSVDRRRARRG
jgi:SSS family solute:Na+ symporter